MNPQLPVLIIIFPLLGAFFIFAAGWFNKRLCFPIGVVVLGFSLFFSIRLLMQVFKQGVVAYKMGGWMPPWGIAYHVDYLSGLVLVVVSAVALLNAVATYRSVAEEFSEKLGPFYTLYVLFVTGLLGMVATGDVFNLYVLLEIAALTGYALIGLGRKRAAFASLNYVFLGTIGASFYLLGIGYLYLITGSLNMADIATLLPPLYSSRVVIFAFVICLIGIFVKMALFPFHGWLPNAYSASPAASVSLIAPLTTKVMVYVMIRITLSVFTPAFTFSATQISIALVWLAIIAIVAGSLMALSQKSLKRILAYIIIAEVGYMVGGFWLGNRDGIIGATLHILNDALMTLCVFLASGAILFRRKHDGLANLKGLFRKMPFTMAALVTGGLSIIGVPPTCGFFSKWYLISGGIAAGQYPFVIALLFSSLVNVVLFFKVFEISYYEPFGDPHHGQGEHATGPIAEAPKGS
jgi:multicomponent Na+:H+ antiporter subunit D